MRSLLLPAVLLGMFVSVDALAVGAYSSVPARDAAACARACADDGLCVAWEYAESACALRATIPSTQLGPVSGFSSRAPGVLRPVTPIEPAPQVAAIAAPTASEAPEQENAPAPLADDEVDAMLLGGLENGGELRPGLGQ